MRTVKDFSELKYDLNEIYIDKYIRIRGKRMRVNVAFAEYLMCHDFHMGSCITCYGSRINFNYHKNHVCNISLNVPKKFNGGWVRVDGFRKGKKNNVETTDWLMKHVFIVVIGEFMKSKLSRSVKLKRLLNV